MAKPDTMIQWLDSLPRKPRQEKGKIRVSIGMAILSDFFDPALTAEEEAKLRSYLAETKTAIPYTKGKITHLIQDPYDCEICKKKTDGTICSECHHKEEAQADMI